MLNFVYLRSSRLQFFAFLAWFMHCQQGGKFEHVLACCRYLEGFQVVSSYFWARAVSRWSSAWPVSSTGLTRVVPRSDRWGGPVWLVKARLKQLLFFARCFACIRPGELHWFWGSLHVCRGALCGFRALDWWFVLFAWACFVSDVSSRCPCLRGPRLSFFKWSCSLPFLWLSIACWSFF
jgi:hypothetical protein